MGYKAWATEHGRPHYVPDLLLSIIGLSMRTMALAAEMALLGY